MASGSEREAFATATEKGSEKVIVTCLVEGLQVGLIGSKPKNAIVTVKIDTQGFDLKAEVNKKDTFRKVVKKLPGQVDRDRSSWKADKGKVIIELVKVKNESWAVQLSQRGLEQQSDEEDRTAKDCSLRPQRKEDVALGKAFVGEEIAAEACLNCCILMKNYIDEEKTFILCLGMGVRVRSLNKGSSSSLLFH